MAVIEKRNFLLIFLRYVITALVTFIFIYPFYSIVIISLSDSEDLLHGFPTWFPRVFSLANYGSIFKSTLLASAAFLSVSRTVLATVLGLLCNSMLAYALTSDRLRGKKFFNQIFLITMYFSGGLIPYYILIRDIGLTNNFLVFILPAAINVYYMIIIKSYYVSLPISVSEGARIDGCNDLQVFLMIIIPMSIPVLAAIGVYYAVGQWNSWWDNFIFANKKGLVTLQLLLVRIIQDADTGASLSSKGGSVMANTATANPVGVRMATTVVVTLPILASYPFFQKYFITGITIGAVKG
jgi:ABC-type sugar transport system, permease component